MAKNPESEYHLVGVRLRLIGSGNFDMSFSGLNDITSQTLVPLVMASTNRIEPTRLGNFQSQRTRFNASVNVIDEWFEVRRLIVYVKPVAVEYPM